MITAKTVESTFRSRWFKKKGKITIKARRNGRQGVNILIDIDGQNFVETLWGIPWKTALMFLRNPTRTADAVIFKQRCVIADDEVWFLQSLNDEWYTARCRTAQHYADGVNIQKSFSMKTIADLIENEPPF